MIDTIIDNNVERIESDLKKRGLTYDRLIDDVLDHVCCLVEEQMESGIDFESSYSGVLDSIGDKRLPEIEYQTLLLLNKKFQRMKKVKFESKQIRMVQFSNMIDRSTADYDSIRSTVEAQFSNQ